MPRQLLASHPEIGDRAVIVHEVTGDLAKHRPWPFYQVV